MHPAHLTQIFLIYKEEHNDEEKDKILNFMGWTVVHFWGKDILKNTEECIRVIEETIFDLEMENNDWGEEL